MTSTFVVCSACAAKLSVPGSIRPGQQFRCPKCSQVLSVSAPTAKQDVAPAPADPAPSVTITIEGIFRELRERHQKGERVRVEEYLDRHPDLRAQPEAVLDLVYNEIMLLQESGETPLLADYQRRFPALADQLRMQFEVDAMLDAGPASGSISDSSSPASIPFPVKTARAVHVPGYELMEVLGRGGMGVVYRARQLALGRVVALKMIIGGAFASPEELARFKTEAAAIARLQHPHIVQIFEVGEVNDQPFFSIELVEGGSLAKRLNGAPCPTYASAALMEKLARAVGYAHQRGIIHRDLKPANILLGRGADGEAAGMLSTLVQADTKDSAPGSATGSPLLSLDVVPKLTDFGLARVIDNPDGQTLSGAFLGTPSYSAPEQASGQSRAVGPHTDIYALGAILYELLTGRPPFRGASPLETLDQVRHVDPVSPRLLNPAAPKDLETICLKCLRKKPTDRYESALELAEDLRRFSSNEPIRARPVGRLEKAGKWIKRNPGVSSVLSLLLLAITAGVSAVAWESNRARSAEGQANVAAADAKKQKERADDERDGAIKLAKELEAKSIALREKTQALQEKTDRLERALATTQINLAESAWNAGNVPLAYKQLEAIPEPLRFWDYRFLKRRFRGDLFSMHGHAGFITALAIRPDGRRLLSAARDKTLRLWDSATGRELAQITEPNIRSVAFHPSGRLFATAAGTSVKIWDAIELKVLHDLKGAGAQVNVVAFHPDGRRLASGSDDHTVVLWDVESGKQLAQIDVPRPDRPLRPREVKALAFSPDGSRVAIDHYFDGIEVWDTEKATMLFSLAKSGGPVVWTPDGKSIIAGGGFGKILVFDADNGVLRITHDPADVNDTIAFAVAPDGLRFASAGSDRMIRVWGLVSGKELLQLQGHAASPVALCFTPDSQRLISGDTHGVIKTWDNATNQLAQVFDTPAPTPGALAFSPDSQWLAVGGVDSLPNPCGIVDIWNVTTGAQVHSLHGHTQNIAGVAFSKDAKLLVTATRGNPLGRVESEVKVWDTQTWKERWRLPGRPGSAWVLDMSPDSRFLACSYASDLRRLLTGPGTVRVWDLERKEEVLTFEATKNAASEIRYSPDGQLLAAVMDLAVFVWELPTGKLRVRFPSDFGVSRGIAFSSDSQRLITCGLVKGVGVIQIHDLIKRERIQTIEGDTTSIGCLAFSPDGERLATGSADPLRPGFIRIWDLRNGQQVLEFKAHRTGLAKLAFSSDGRFLASSGNGDGRVQVWDAPLMDDPVAFQNRLNAEPKRTLPEVLRRESMTAFDKTRHLALVKDREKNAFGFAAAYHLGQLLQVEPVHLDHHRRRVQALAQFHALKVDADGLRKLLDRHKHDAELHCSVGLVQRDQKLFDDALRSLQRGHEMGARQEHWTYPSAQWLKECEAMRDAP